MTAASAHYCESLGRPSFENGYVLRGLAPSREQSSSSKPRPAGKIDITRRTFRVSVDCRGKPLSWSRISCLASRNQHSRLSQSGGTLLGSFFAPFFRNQYSVDRSADFNDYTDNFRSRYSDRGSGTKWWRHDLCLSRRCQHASASGADSQKRSHSDYFAET
jgi:hypothetical protein